jgi:hypothetical protein
MAKAVGGKADTFILPSGSAQNLGQIRHALGGVLESIWIRQDCIRFAFHRSENARANMVSLPKPFPGGSGSFIGFLDIWQQGVLFLQSIEKVAVFF